MSLVGRAEWDEPGCMELWNGMNVILKLLLALMSLPCLGPI